MPATAALVFCGIGVLLMFVGTVGFVRQFLLKRACTLQVKARVSFLPCKPASEAGKQMRLLAKIVSKTTPGEQDRTKSPAMEGYYEVLIYPVLGVERVVPTGHYSLDNFSYSTGKNLVTVAYDPFKPTRYIILDKGAGLVSALIVVLVGAVFATIPLVPMILQQL